MKGDPPSTTVPTQAGPTQSGPIEPREPISEGNRPAPAPPPAPLGDPAAPLTGNLLSRTMTSGRPAAAYIPPQPLEELCWRARYRVEKLLGRGAQGAVYQARREGADGYVTNVALKIYYRHPKTSDAEYVAEMRRIAAQGEHVSRIQHDNLIAIRDFVSIDNVRVMVLEWIDGLDLGRLLDLRTLARLGTELGKSEWERLNDVVVTSGRDHCRLKAGIAVDVLRGCLAGLAALHHSGVAHCDLKPSNIMIKRAGTKKIIDIDSSCLVDQRVRMLRGTPYYMAPEHLQQQSIELRSDVASLGYILIEMLTGRRLFRDCSTMPQLVEAKLKLPQKLEQILPAEIRNDPFLFGLVRKMVAIKPEDRFPDADAADLDSVGAARFHRHLVQTNLSTDYVREIAWWIDGVLNRFGDVIRGDADGDLD